MLQILQCQKEEPIKYVNICRFRLNCPKVEKVREPKEPLIKFKKWVLPGLLEE